MSTVILSFSVSGLSLNRGDDVFVMDTDKSREEWDALTFEQQEEEARVLFNEQVQFGWSVAPEGTEV